MNLGAKLLSAGARFAADMSNRAKPQKTKFQLREILGTNEDGVQVCNGIFISSSAEN